MYNKDEKQLNNLQTEYRYIRNRLEELSISGDITEYTKRIIFELSAKVLESLTKNYTQVQKGVWNIMVGKVIETEAKTILNQGITQGKIDTYLELLRDGLISVTDAAKRLCLSEDAVKEMMK